MNKPNKSFHKAISASYTLVGSVVLFGGVGYILKTKLNNENWLIGCLITGALIGLYELYKQINKWFIFLIVS